MKTCFWYLATAGVLALGSSMAQAQVPAVPPNLQIKDGSVLFLSGHAEGTQNYICLPTPDGFAWTFFSPQATLFTDFKVGPFNVKQQIITHFLSPNPDEGGTGRATWQSSLDSSEVWAKTAPNGVSTDATFVAVGAIPWLLLDKVGARRGQNGGDILANTTHVQRLNTSGGLAPTTGCSESANVGATALKQYTADYFFYKAK